MKLDGSSFQTTDWSGVEPTAHPGEAGTATSRGRVSHALIEELSLL